MTKQSRIHVALTLLLSIPALLICNLAFAQTDEWYVGGPDGLTLVGTEMSETWTMRGEGDNVGPDDHLKPLRGKRITLKKEGGKFYLIPDNSGGNALNWSPAKIPLADLNFGGWRWKSAQPVTIANHEHTVCIGFPSVQAKRDEDSICVGIGNIDDKEGCEDCSNQHPGHSTADR